MYVTFPSVFQVVEVERCHKKHVATRNPHEDGVLEAAGEIGVICVPRDIVVLKHTSNTCNLQHR